MTSTDNVSDINLRVLDTVDLTTDINLLRDQADKHRSQAETYEKKRKAEWRDYYKIKQDIEKKEEHLKVLMEEIGEITPERKRKAPCPDAPKRYPKLQRS